MGQIAVGAIAAARVGIPESLMAKQLKKVGVQLYTARDEMAKDVEATLATIASIGYKEIEFAGYFDKTPQAIRQMLDRHGLTSPSTHIDLATISTKLPQTLEASHTIGQRYIVMPYLDDATRAQPDIYKKVADTLNKAGAEAKKANIEIAYHNHNFEFVAVNGTSPFESLMQMLDPKLVNVELDLCWATSANQDPVALFKKYPGRFPMVHVKGLRKKPATGAATPIADVLPDVTDVGHDGDIIDWKTIFAQSSVGGVRHYFVEHDQPKNKDPFASLRASYGYLKDLKF
ncbi:MAG: sugar phosphate isomerase/epimerase [Acidobacteriota bacterium]